ncbi:hypothetical protein PVAP13_3KG498904 [Panicum virgatum]|uniref:Uncharacterized protein n=1 Tax=Panicum virgatum TaxID=38727 RepID=A0A8T0V6J7_PANVG|nr:hypothetical protein PVAP13_3KG498904 [Panicum virgatum]
MRSCCAMYSAMANMGSLTLPRLWPTMMVSLRVNNTGITSRTMITACTTMSRRQAIKRHPGSARELLILLQRSAPANLEFGNTSPRYSSKCPGRPGPNRKIAVVWCTQCATIVTRCSELLPRMARRASGGTRHLAGASTCIRPQARGPFSILTCFKRGIGRISCHSSARNKKNRLFGIRCFCLSALE